MRFNEQELIPTPPLPSPAEQLFREYPVQEQIFREVSPLLVEGRPYNWVHTAWGLGDIYTLIKGEELPNLLPIVAGAFQYHDAGWPRVPNVKDDPSVWSSLDGRVLHMQAGAEVAGESLPKFGYTPDQVATIQDIILHHDDVYLAGQELTTPILQSHEIKLPQIAAEKMHRDADALFVFSEYFWKDWWLKGRPKGISPQEFLEKQVEKYGHMNTRTGQELVDRKIADRQSEAAQPSDNFETFYRITEDVSSKSIKMTSNGYAPKAVLKEVNVLLQGYKK